MKQSVLKEGEPIYMWVKLAEAKVEEGKAFGWAVAAFKVTPESTLEQSGPGVLCQTQAEAQETVNNLQEGRKRYMARVTTAGFGTVAWVTGFRRTCNNIGVAWKERAGGKKYWVAFDHEVDLDTLERKGIRRQETETEKEAQVWAKKWLDEYKAQEKKREEASGNGSAVFLPLGTHAVPKPRRRASRRPGPAPKGNQAWTRGSAGGGEWGEVAVETFDTLEQIPGDMATRMSYYRGADSKRAAWEQANGKKNQHGRSCETCPSAN
jgi:hypothetical protein